MLELRKSDIGFLKQIISNKFDANYSKYQEYLNQTRTSNTEIDFEKLAKLVLADKSLKMGQLYAECSKRDIANDGKHWLRIREMLGDKCKKAYCDAGSLKIGSVNGDFSILVSSGGGDEMMRYAVVEKNEFNENMLNYFGQIEGDIAVYDYDCGTVENDVAEELHGKFHIYQGYGFVVIEEV